MNVRSMFRAALGVVLVSAAATGCIPGPTLVLTTTTTDDGVDANPGDGVCEVTGGVGDCSLRAAVQEANAGDGARVVLTAGATYVLDVPDGDGDADLDVTSRVVLAVSSPGGVAAIRRTDDAALALDVGATGSVSAERVSPASARVAGSLALTGADLYREGAAVEVLPGGGAVLANTRVVAAGGPVVRNGGALVLLHAEIRGLAGSAAIETTAGATTALGSTLVLNSTFFGTGTFVALESTPHCVGPVSSLGHNYAGSTDCGLVSVGDVPPTSFSPLGTWPGTLVNTTIPANAPTIDRIPIGTLGCGSTLTHDVLGAPRPVDGDGDGTSACDIGAIERSP